MRDSTSIVDFDAPERSSMDFPNAVNFALARAWPTMSLREKITGIVGSILVGVGGALIIVALLG